MDVLLNILHRFSFHNKEEECVSTCNARKIPFWISCKGKARHHTDCYYFPDFEMYYSVITAKWIWFDGHKWIRSDSLPEKYIHINLFCAYKVGLNHKGTKPHLYHEDFKEKYPSRSGRSFYKEFGSVRKNSKVVMQNQTPIIHS